MIPICAREGNTVWRRRGKQTPRYRVQCGACNPGFVWYRVDLEAGVAPGPPKLFYRPSLTVEHWPSMPEVAGSSPASGPSFAVCVLCRPRSRQSAAARRMTTRRGGPQIKQFSKAEGHKPAQHMQERCRAAHRWLTIGQSGSRHTQVAARTREPTSFGWPSCEPSTRRRVRGSLDSLVVKPAVFVVCDGNAVVPAAYMPAAHQRLDV